MSGIGRLYRGETDIDFIGRRKAWLSVSTVLVLLSLVVLLTSQLNFGIEFKGGVQTKAPVEDPALLALADTDIISEIRGSLASAGATDAQIQIVTEDDTKSVLVQTKEIADPDEQQAFVEAVAAAAGTTLDKTDSERIGSKWGSQITGKALRALIIFLLVILAFISWRFEWKMALAAIIALVHDLLITAGVYSAVGFEVTPSTIVAILTILGYSLYDTVVVFDKVEENTNTYAIPGRLTYEGSANLSMNQVFMRSINTSLTTLLPVAALLFVGAGLLGASTLKDLALALLVGILAGTYSSIFVATPVLTILKEHEPRFQSVRQRIERDAKKQAKVEATVGAGADDPLATTSTADASMPAERPLATPVPRPPAKGRAGAKKAKRRKRR